MIGQVFAVLAARDIVEIELAIVLYCLWQLIDDAWEATMHLKLATTGLALLCCSASVSIETLPL